MLFPLLLLVLALTLSATVAATWLLSSGSLQKAAIAERSGMVEEEPRSERIRRDLERRIASTRPGRRLGEKLHSAGVGVSPLLFSTVAGGVGLAAFVVSNRVLPGVFAVIVGALGVRACLAYLDYREGKRREAFIGQLPDVARVLSNASAAGLSTRTAVELGASELEEPARSEMALVSEDMRIGQSLEGALRKLEQRLPSRDIGVLISTLVIQQRSGGDLVRALQEIADTLDARRDLYREIKTLMAGSVATGWVVAFMGLAAVLMLNLVRPGIIEEMTSTWAGRIAFLVSCSLYFVGFVLVRRVTRIEI